MLQAHADFSDAIEAARRRVFPAARPARDYPHMMRAVNPRTLQVLRSARSLPTADLFRAIWRVFLQELQDAGQ